VKAVALVAIVALFGCTTSDPRRIIIESRDQCAAASQQPFEQSVAEIRAGFMTKALGDPRTSSIPPAVRAAYLICVDRQMPSYTQDTLAACWTYGSINQAKASEIAYRQIFKPCQAESLAFQAELRERQTSR
jgi:hypothetical protein